MSGTRSPFLPVPATSQRALVLAAHGDLGGRAADNTPWHLRLKKALTPLLPAINVVSGVLKGTPHLQDVVARLGQTQVFVLPLLLSNGYFCNNVLPRRLGLRDTPPQQKEGWQRSTPLGQYIKLLPPLGVLPFLPDLVSQSIQSTIGEAENNLSRQILLVAHGSTIGPQSRLCAFSLQQQLQTRLGYTQVQCAFLSQAPYVEQVIQTLKPGSVVVPLFASGGLHGHDDINTLMKQAPKGCHLAPIIGCEHTLASHLCHYLAEVNALNF